MRKLLLKLSGEVLAGEAGRGFDRQVLGRLAEEIAEGLRNLWLGIVVGAGNFVRGRELGELPLSPSRADTIGMVATTLNALALEDVLASVGVRSVVLSALPISGVVEPYSEKALRQAEREGLTVIFCGGTGNPFLTTDTAAAIRAGQMGAGLLLKGTKVRGVFSADPVKDPEAEFFRRLTYQEVLEKQLQVMDLTAITLCREKRIAVRVFQVIEPGNLAAALRGEELGTLITE